jgi:hypothetical protein
MFKTLPPVWCQVLVASLILRTERPWVLDGSWAAVELQGDLYRGKPLFPCPLLSFLLHPVPVHLPTGFCFWIQCKIWALNKQNHQLFKDSKNFELQVGIEGKISSWQDLAAFLLSREFPPITLHHGNGTQYILHTWTNAFFNVQEQCRDCLLYQDPTKGSGMTVGVEYPSVHSGCSPLATVWSPICPYSIQLGSRTGKIHR